MSNCIAFSPLARLPPASRYCALNTPICICISRFHVDAYYYVDAQAHVVNNTHNLSRVARRIIPAEILYPSTPELGRCTEPAAGSTFPYSIP